MKQTLAICMLAWLLSAGSPAQTNAPEEGSGKATAADDEEVFDLDDTITPPRVVHQVTPRHVHESRGFRVGGVVLIGLVVSSKGVPRNLHILKSLDTEVDQSALDAVREWRFEPAKKKDKPVAVNISVEIRFHDM